MNDRDPSALTEEELAELHATVTPAEMRQLMPVLGAIRRWVDVEIAPDTDLVTPRFNDRFSLALRVFHALHDRGQVLTKKGFEFAFKEAYEADPDRTAVITDNPTMAGGDLLLDGTVAVSLKTEAAKGIQREKITISKLMESAWTKDCRTASDFHGTIGRVVQHLGTYDRVFILRVFGRLDRTGTVRYELWEIPIDVLRAASTLQVDDFGSVTKAHGVTAMVRSRKEALYRLVFDGSDQKITIRDLKVGRCKLHAAWSLS